MFRAGQYSFTTAKIVMDGSRPIAATTPIKNLDEILITSSYVSLVLRIPGATTTTTCGISGLATGITRRNIISTIREAIREHYLSFRMQGDKIDLPMIDRLLIDSISYDRETKTIHPNIERMPSLTKELPRDPGF
jgi:hypothetical protein